MEYKVWHFLLTTQTPFVQHDESGKSKLHLCFIRCTFAEGCSYEANDATHDYRIPDFFRIDAAINIEGNHKIKKLAHSSWTVGVYNLTGRKNPFSVYFVSEEGKLNGYKLSIFGHQIPFITYNFRF